MKRAGVSRWTRINTIWRKELTDTLRDRRTLIAMILVPMVLYPALMLGSLQAMQVQVSGLVREQYDVGVASEAARQWLRRLLDGDPARQPRRDSAETAEEAVLRAEKRESATQEEKVAHEGGARSARAGVKQAPPEYRIVVVDNLRESVAAGQVHAALLLPEPLPRPDGDGSANVTILYDESEIRSEIAASGLDGVLDRAGKSVLARRLARQGLSPAFVRPLDVTQVNVASSEKMAGSVLGQIVPLILILMTITGAIYPAIDLTAGERERGTLETLMAAPVPTVDLIAGKFIVVALIGMMSAVLNLISIGGTIYLGRLGDVLAPGGHFVFPLSALPWTLLMLIPLAVMFAAMLLAVCSFARSFKEAQNYIMPVMIAALIPGVVGILPGTRLTGAMVIMPVANIVVMTRELFMGRFDVGAIAWVVLSTSLYAGAAVAVAARLFGQEAVLFADAGSIKTLFQRRFFKPTAVPSAAAAMLIATMTYVLNFYVQNAISQSAFSRGAAFLGAIGITLVVLMVALPWATTVYLRADAIETFRLRMPRPAAWVAALCLGSSTWILGRWWLTVQERWLSLGTDVARQIEESMGWIDQMPLGMLLFFMAIAPALCEELFFRGFVLSGLRSNLGKAAAITISALAFGLFHYMAQRMVVTTALGVALGLLAVQFRSIWPSVIAHMMHNAFSLAADREDGLGPLLKSVGYASDSGQSPTWTVLAAVVAMLGVAIALAQGRAANYGMRQKV